MGYPSVEFEIEIKRPTVEILPSWNTAFEEESDAIDNKITIIIKTFRRYFCLSQARCDT